MMRIAVSRPFLGRETVIFLAIRIPDGPTPYVSDRPSLWKRRSCWGVARVGSTVTAKSKLSHPQSLKLFLATPAKPRRERGVDRRLRSARFPGPGTLKSFDWKDNE